MQLSLNKLPWYSQLGAFVALCAAAVGTFWYVYDSPAQAHIREQQQQLDAIRAEIVRGQNIARKLPEFRAQIGDLETRLDGLRAVLPEQKDVGDLLRRIQTLATQSSLEIRGFKPQPIVQKQMHAEWPISLSLEGTYHDLASFFDKVSKVPRIINISGITIKARDNDRGARAKDTGSGATIVAECLATTFVLSEGPPPSSTKAGKKGAAGQARPVAPPARPAGR